MNIFKRLLAAPILKGFIPSQWVTVYPSDVIENQLLQSNKEWVFVSVDKVAKAVAAVRFKVMRYSGKDDDQEAFDGPMVDFLEVPGPSYTGKDFIYLGTAYKELTGNAFWELLPGNQVRPLIPSAVQPVVKDGRITGYKYTGEGKEREIAFKNVLHDRYVDPAKPWWGAGKLQKIARWVDTSSYANEFLRLFFVNGAQFGGFIETEEESEDRIKLIKAGLANDHVGVQNAHKIAVLPKGSKFAAATASMSDMQFRELDESYRDKILAAFGVPKTLVGFTTEVNRASAEASEYIFAKYTVKPIVDDFIEFLNARVAPIFDPSGKFYFAYDNFIPENEELKLKEREIALAKQPYKTVNEVRAEVGLPPVPNGDTIYSAPGTQLGEKPPVLSPGGGDKPGDKPGKAAPMRARKAEKIDGIINGIVDRAIQVIERGVLSDEETHRAFASRVDDHQAMLKAKIKDFNGQQKQEVMQRLQRITKAVAKSDVFDMDAEVSVLVDFVTPLLKGLMVEQAIAEYEAQGFGGYFDQEGSSIARIIEQAAKRLSAGYNDTTATLLKKALNEGIAANEPFDQLAARVAQVYAYSDVIRAEAVAKTESFYIANEGSREAYRQSGVVKSVRWYTAEDERTCAFCGPLHGKVIGVNETFFSKGDEAHGIDGSTMKLDYRSIDVPPLHPYCRCFIRPEHIEIS